MQSTQKVARSLLHAAYQTVGAPPGHAMDAEALFAALFFEMGPEALTPEALDRLGRLYRLCPEVWCRSESGC
ncbi:hypothetical protein HLH33_17800 [Gluconacetobacter diazotrophicus]|uniref:Uncharacterized protein n=1 Tax=Gluconacetobacter diazotrophicus TaxID=33996 RepID=A0A7W4NI24_GLUDI|nr:hypothetical protein [Gluconacetobacter diazotrophicus]MBB2158127.1 hypothetical protein [Gluconacetobacter diazotrophicus]